ncbi:hypothetical protein SAMN02910289_00915 [Lachnospiraceae bacterium RM5]|nr:hypothetical protein SAMN02910289_00915 [Lachnospiraceae bacterium RM5]
MDLEKLVLHDEKLISINMISKADFFDEIIIKTEYQDNTLIIQCKNCYSAKLDCNLFISGCDTIRSFYVENIIMEKNISKYPEKNISIPLKKIYINLNTSNSVIEVLAKEITYCYENEDEK